MAEGGPAAGERPAIDWSQLPPASRECCCPQVFQFIFAEKVIHNRFPPWILLLLFLLLLLGQRSYCPVPVCYRPVKERCRKKKRRCD